MPVATLVIEILSPTDTFRKVIKRVTHFLSEGTRLVWVIDPEEQILSVIRPPWRSKDLTIDQEVTGEDVLPDLRVEVADFFTLLGE